MAENVLPIYIGVFLSAHSRTILLNEVVNPVVDLAKYHRTIAEHLTVVFKPTEREVAVLGLGRQTALDVLAIHWDERAVAVEVRPEGVGCANKVPHITIALAKEVTPVYSNELLIANDRETLRLAQPVRLRGMLDAFPRRFV